MKITQKRKPTGFTLIEILIVVVIIGLVVAIIAPTIHNARTEARVAKQQAIETAIALAITRGVIKGEINPADWGPSYKQFKKYLVINGVTAPPIASITDGHQNGIGKHIYWWGAAPIPNEYDGNAVAWGDIEYDDPITDENINCNYW